MTLKADGIVVHYLGPYSGDLSKIDVATIRRWHTAKPPMGRGWADVGYQKIILWPKGEVKQGRPDTTPGAHCFGHNSHTIGVLVVTNGKPTPEQVHSLIQTLAHECKENGIPANRIFGHRDLNATECPGDALYALLPEIRRRVGDYLD